MSKRTKIIRENEEIKGYTEIKSGEIGVNIELLWNQNKNEKKFIKEFCKVLRHELIHREILNILPKRSNNKYYYGEEMIVRKMLNEKFNKEEKEYYKNEVNK